MAGTVENAETLLTVGEAAVRPGRYVETLSAADTRFLLAHNECMDCQATFNLKVLRRNRKKVVLCTDCVKATVPAPRRKGKQLRRNEPVVVNARAPDNTVEATENLGPYRGRYVPRGTRLDRDDEIVRLSPMSFQVRYRLDLEVVEQTERDP